MRSQLAVAMRRWSARPAATLLLSWELEHLFAGSSARLDLGGRPLLDEMLGSRARSDDCQSIAIAGERDRDADRVPAEVDEALRPRVGRPASTAGRRSAGAAGSGPSPKSGRPGAG